MENIEKFLTTASDLIWGPPLLILLIGTGIYLTLRLTFIQLRLLPYSLKQVFSRKHDKKADGDISQFQALMTAMAATVGVGNIVGVASAVVAGGPGAIFWMWLAGFFGMATKYSEAILAVKYRVKDSNGLMAGGPMYYLEHGLKQKWLGVLFAIFGALAAFGIGNGTQSKAVADVMKSTFEVPHYITGIALVLFGALVILGGIKSIGRVTAFFVPIMALFYFIAGAIVMVLNFEQVPAAFGLIFTDAFTGQAVAGGAIGTVIRFGVARGLFSNEAGLGSAPIAAAAARTDMPGRQALVSMTQVLFDTLIICSITGVTIVMSNQWQDKSIDAGALTAQAFGSFLGNTGPILVSIGLVFFATSTILGWSYYGEKCFQYLFPNRVAVLAYRVVFVAFIYVGATASLDLVWILADVLNGLMAIPNLIGLLGLSGVVIMETKRFKKKIDEEREEARK
ncbi:MULTISPECIES: sodium:alanine symporter family protein [unclassified Sporosarcina]|uniref:alanine/glycine:cation symporter family protein n=1 Tax=unclassified Sporosarcina TaxID=2647733 RepID=UPI000C167EA8|nr:MULTISPECIES: sodium:alanine symporter family protein [unclassified Sporosarcina]PIC85543.1 sodium:alanine symporter family protein [Sporosarcina sp. P20a]PIC98397.1 sodium:alanine symporter family protein [Sporosarcina sp. P29]PID04750.1 sodium:alanine symporter family protein [Sporosarcina sp. P30]PID07904.1 sodium:alanine symporter family protein [Sporosarcina sp. P31]PID11090.1 sodium:alanine symporter family protein [Sporosarcina sp. P32b]